MFIMYIQIIFIYGFNLTVTQHNIKLNLLFNITHKYFKLIIIVKSLRTSIYYSK